MTQHKENPLKTLQEIRQLMERSSRFISLSGLSGVTAGVIALIGASIAHWYIGKVPFQGYDPLTPIRLSSNGIPQIDYLFFFGLASTMLVLAVGAGIFFTTRSAKAKGQKIWDALTQRLLINLCIPLVAGGIFCLAALLHGLIFLIAPSTLLFYGLGLVNASKYTLPDVRYLGLSEIALGLIGLFVPGYGLELWGIGFGLLHIIYGSRMYFRYEYRQ
ncbi:MAG: hypothetical protein AAF798_12590 [Bacteroidota bacterium]